MIRILIEYAAMASFVLSLNFWVPAIAVLMH
jgi:hypothetical protein